MAIKTIDASGTLYDYIREVYDLKSDGALAEWLEQPAPMVSKVRHNKAQVNAKTIIKVIEKTGWDIAFIYARLPKKTATKTARAKA